MTLPDERTRAVLNAGAAIVNITQYLHGRGETVRVPRDALRRLADTLRHYPSSFDLDRAAEKASDVFGSPRPQASADVASNE